jgi:hypothetical protein
MGSSCLEIGIFRDMAIMFWDCIASTEYGVWIHRVTSVVVALCLVGERIYQMVILRLQGEIILAT